MNNVQCKFCHGNGCLACPDPEKEKETTLPEPLFTARLDNPEDMKLLEMAFGKEVLDFAFADDVDPIEKALTGRGGGMQTLEQKARIARFLQALGGENKK